ncbi:multicilin [Alligator mississippiensis]|uniref:Multicilin n=1 Tax=Alligator mississippiensis TaxID=8496 RepID=A0A151MX78_ALLMI|nr:multicilin [Alligator mississippiensis]
MPWLPLRKGQGFVRTRRVWGRGPGQAPCLQPELSFDFQEFRDAVSTFLPDPTDLMPPPLDAAGFSFPLSDGSAFSPCLQTAPGASIPQPSLPGAAPAEQYWKEVADHNQRALGDALVENSQLHVTLSQKQEEITSLKEKNVQLKELASQAKQLASVLNRLLVQQAQEAPDASHPKGSVKRSLEDLFATGQEGCEGVDEILQEISDKCHAALQTLDESKDMKRLRLQVEECQAIPLHGAFNGLETCCSQSSVELGDSELEEGLAFRTSIKEHGTIRTLAFPQGNAFTIRTATGGYKFRWVPS